MNSAAVIYEVRLAIASEIAEEFDRWLSQHVAEMLRFDGFESADTIAAESDAPDEVLRIVRYRVRTRELLQHYLDTHAAAMRADGIHRFGDQMRVSRDIYPAQTDHNPDTGLRCQNCQAVLTGQYCAACGQRNEHRVISVMQLVREFIGDLFELDSRLWRTVIPLLFRPGKLTTEYLRGRRVHYTPPVRLYLVTSLFFFLVAFFDTQVGGIIDLEATEQNGETVIAPIVIGPGDAPDTTTPEADRDPKPPTESQDPQVDEIDGAQQQPPDDAEQWDGCDSIQLGDTEFEGRLATRARRVCEKLTSPGGANRFVESFVDNLPGLMFIFLPVVALFMKLLYPFSARYYVEHLLFLLHFHSFFFLSWTMVMLFSRLPDALPGKTLVSVLVFTALLFYTPIYLFVALGRVYKQHLLVRLLKFAILGTLYLVSLVTLFTGLMALTALSL